MKVPSTNLPLVRPGRLYRRAKRLPIDRHLVVLLAILLACSVFALVAFTTDAGAQPEQIDSCTAINESGHYELSDTVQTDQEESCIVVDASDVVDGDGHAVEGPADTSLVASGHYAL